MSRALSDLAGVFDIECAEWDRFVCGCILHADGTKTISWSEDEYAIALLDCEGVYYAHAGGRYDLLWLLDYCIRHAICVSDVKPRGSGIMSMKIGDLECRDSYALIPMSLAKCGPIGGQAKSTLALPCECGTVCGGYCALARPLSRAEKAIVTEYLVQDCVTLLATLLGLARRCDAVDITPGLTVGGTAWGTARRWGDLPSCKHDLGRYDAIRRAYSGGLTLAIVPRWEGHGERYDIRSSYTAALSRVSLPVGTPRHVKARAAGDAYLAGREGVYRARVRVPDMHVPPLPARECDRLLYPTGPIDGVWTGLELRYAETLGVKIESVLYAYAWDNAYPILRPFAARGWSIRADNAATGDPGDAAFAAWVKWFLNSLTGKTGQLPDHETLVFVPAIDGPPILDKDAEIVGESDYGAWVIVRSRRVDACAHVEWAAHLTAEARIELHRQLLHAGDGVLYCDTDSVYSTRALTRRVGPGLGEWGHEGSLSDWTCLAPKVYRYYDPDTGKVNVRGKGMSDLNSAGFDTLAAGGKWIVDRGVDGLKTALRSHSSELFRRKHLSRSLTPFPGWIGGRVLHGAGTRAPTVAEYRARKT